MNSTDESVHQRARLEKDLKQKEDELELRTLWDPWGLFFIHLTHESGIYNYKGMNSEGMNLR
jgi:hypothetical protein